jgi:hypothetical protein
MAIAWYACTEPLFLLLFKCTEIGNRNFKDILLDAYRWLSENHEPGDRIFLFGMVYAAAARSPAHVWCRILPRSLPSSRAFRNVRKGQFGISPCLRALSGDRSDSSTKATKGRYPCTSRFASVSCVQLYARAQCLPTVLRSEEQRAPSIKGRHGFEHRRWGPCVESRTL